jgi:hypothetical protein
MRLVAGLVCSLLGVLAGMPARAVEQGPRVTFVAGADGWFSDAMSGGIVSLRANVTRKSAPDELPGTLLFLCSTSEDRLIFQPSPNSSMRTVEPASSGVAYVTASPSPGKDSKDADAFKVFGSAKSFTSGSFEISDLPTANRNTARALVAEIAKGTPRFRFQLSSSPVQGGFERDKTFSFEFVVGKKDKQALDGFETACKLVTSRKL